MFKELMQCQTEKGSLFNVSNDHIVPPVNTDGCYVLPNNLETSSQGSKRLLPSLNKQIVPS